MRVLCVGRHQFLSEHLCRFFEKLDVAAVPCVGMREAMNAISVHEPDAVICDYDLLATSALGEWENDPALNGVPIIAVSLTRHPGEAHVMDVNAIAGFLYLPTLDPDAARRLLAGVRVQRSAVALPKDLPWPGTSPVAQVR
jgi:chemotaxis response regulator CheB